MPPKNTKKFKQDPTATIKSFSKNLLGLKFMQRAKKEVEKKISEVDESVDPATGNRAICLPNSNINQTYQFCERLRFGRFSYKGMNPDIEQIMFNNREIKPEEPIASRKRAAPESDTSSDNEIDDLDSDDPDETNDDDAFERKLGIS